MASELPAKIFPLKAPDKKAIKEMVDIYLKAYRYDKTMQLEATLPHFIARMAETIANRCIQPECKFIVARTKNSNRVIGWLALVFKLENHIQISEEHALLIQYALLPDIVAKAQRQGIGTADLKDIARKVFKDFKEAREKHLPDRHCILSTLVVDPDYQNKGVASALLTVAINRSGVFLFPIWVQAPPAHQGLFEKNLFEQVGEYELDLNEHVPIPEGKRKTRAAASTLDKYAWKFMVREKPLEDAIRAFKSSKVFAELDRETQADERRLVRSPELKSNSKAAGKQRTAPEVTGLLSGGDVPTATIGENMFTRYTNQDDE